MCALKQALDQVLAFTPLVNNWGWHGSAFGMGDFGNNGYVRGDERELHHYRSGLNAIPSTEQYLHDPTDIYLLRLAAGRWKEKKKKEKKKEKNAVSNPLNAPEDTAGMFHPRGGLSSAGQHPATFMLTCAQ